MKGNSHFIAVVALVAIEGLACRNPTGPLEVGEANQRAVFGLSFNLTGSTAIGPAEVGTSAL
jgi:hypothetical protein